MDAVCFDMDGVLVDSEDFWVPREREELFPALVPDSEVESAEIAGMNYRDIYDYLAERYGVAMGREEYREWYEATAGEIYGEEVRLLDGVPELLERLRGRGVAVALVSSSPHRWIDTVRDRFGLAFDEVVGADAVDAPGKPEPHVYRHAADLLGVAPEATVAVEDSGHGVAAARRAGMHVVGFRHGVARDGDRSDADYVATSPADLRDHLLAKTA